MRNEQDTCLFLISRVAQDFNFAPHVALRNQNSSWLLAYSAHFTIHSPLWLPDTSPGVGHTLTGTPDFS